MLSMLPDGGRRKLECLALIDLRCWSAMSLLMFIILTATGVGPAVDHSGVAPPQEFQTPGRSIRLAVPALKAFLGSTRGQARTSQVITLLDRAVFCLVTGASTQPI